LDRTHIIESLIKTKYKSVRQFSKIIDVPHTTITSMLKTGIGGTGVDTVLKICKELNISLDSLCDNNFNIFYVSSQEQKIIEQLRQLPPQDLDKIIGMIEMKIYEVCSKKNDFKEKA